MATAWVVVLADGVGGATSGTVWLRADPTRFDSTFNAAAATGPGERGLVAAAFDV